MAGRGTKIDEVARNQIWEEHCKKELKNATLKTNFSIADPRKMDLLPEKPNHVVPNTKVNMEDVQGATATLRTLCSATGANASFNEDVHPSEKYDIPQTSAQEYGWYSSPKTASPKKNPFFEHPRKSSEISSYADRYHVMTGVTPFTRKPVPK
eukprot:jgi/Mesvir1/23970/Mv10733-RA.1